MAVMAPPDGDGHCGMRSRAWHRLTRPGGTPGSEGLAMVLRRQRPNAAMRRPF